MNESGVYSEPDLRSFSQRIEQLRSLIREDAASGKHPVAMTRLLERKLNTCGEHRRVINATCPNPY